MNENSDGNNESLSVTSDAVVEECEKEMQDIFEWDNMGTEGMILSPKQQQMRQLSKTYVEKRVREESEEGEENCEDEFITVTRRQPKRLNRSNSNKQSSIGSAARSEDEIEVCITSLQILPKQMALAKLLKTEKIDNILKIKYKSPYKVVIQVQNKNEAEKIIKCRQLADIGCRCQILSELNLSYGVVKGVDLETEDKDMLEIFQTDVEIVSIIRLKRLDTQGKWVNSETIRICFNNPTIPEYVYAYSCRFKVERYVFPVTQCSGCWKFGHPVKFCPTTKIKCPKCGDNHVNCETTDIKCLNCKGNHIVLDKACPHFLREKRIRIIMSEKNLTYRKAWQLVLSEKESGHNKLYRVDNCDSQSVILPTTYPAWTNSEMRSSSNVTTTAIIHREDTVLDKKREQPVKLLIKKKKTQPDLSKKPKTVGKEPQQKSFEESQESGEESKDEENQETHWNKPKRNFELLKLLEKLKDIILSNLEFNEKLQSIFRVLYDEVKFFITKFILSADCIQPFFRFFYG